MRIPLMPAHYATQKAEERMRKTSNNPNAQIKFYSGANFAINRGNPSKLPEIIARKLSMRHYEVARLFPHHKSLFIFII